MPQHDFDLFTIGAGSGGVRASRTAAGLGARVAVAESRRLGGTCVNVGCVPKKLLVYASQFSAAFEDARGFGWTIGDNTFDWGRLIANKDREIDRLNEVYRTLLEGSGVSILEGRARLVDRHTVDVGGNRYTADKILIASGGRPHVVDIPGAEYGISSDEVFYLPTLPRRIVIVGGGYIAVEFAGIFNGLGSEVHLLHRGPLFLRGFDDDVRTTLAAEMTRRGVRLRFDTRPTQIARHGDGVVVALPDGSQIQADVVLCGTGRVPNTSDLGLEQLGVELTDRNAVVVDQFSESSVSGIYAIGDCTDRRALTPVALAEAMAFVETVFKANPTSVSYSNVPSAVFSQPSVGTVGLTEDEARRDGFDVRIFRSTFRPMVHTLSGRDERTMMKLVVDRVNDRVLGVHMVGPDAGEIIQGMAVALTCGATKAQFDATIGIHPTAAEEFVTMRDEAETP
jgi:glutathione reductase (NADPH)